MKDDGVYRSTNTYFNYVIDEMIAEHQRREEQDRKDEPPHVFLLTTVITFGLSLWAYLVLVVLFFFHYWYWLLIAFVLLPVTEYAPQYSTQIGNITGLIIGPINTVFIPALNTLWNCLNGVRIVYNHVIQIIRAVLHIVLVQVSAQFGTGPISFVNAFVVIRNLLTFVFFIIEMVASLISTVAAALVGLFTDSGDTFDFSFIDLIVGVIIDVVALILDPYRCFTPVDDIPYSILECLSRGNLPHPMLNRTDIKAAGTDGIIKALIIDICGVGDLSSSILDLILNCIDFQSIGNLFTGIFNSQSILLGNTDALLLNLDTLQAQFNYTNSVFEAMSPTLVDDILLRLCGGLKDTVYCDATRTVVTGIVQQGSLLQSINTDAVHANHSVLISDPVADTKVCIRDRATHRQIICLHSVGRFNRMNVDAVIDELRANLTVVRAQIAEAQETIASILHNYTTPHALEQEDVPPESYRAIQTMMVTANTARYFNTMPHDSINYLRATALDANETAHIETLPNPRPHIDDIRMHYAKNSVARNTMAGILLDITFQAIALANSSVVSWRKRGPQPDNYFFVYDHLKAGGFDPHRIFTKINEYYGMPSHAIMVQNAADIQISIVGAVASFAVSGGGTFTSILNGFFIVVVGVIMFASMMLGALGGLVNGLNNTPGVHFDFGSSAMTEPFQQFLTFGVNEPVPPLILQTLLTVYVVRIAELIEWILLNIFRLLMCEFPVSMGSITCPPEVQADFNNPQIFQLTYSYFFNVTMCKPDKCSSEAGEGVVGMYGAMCVNGTILCWPELPFITIPPIGTIENNDMSMCTIHDVSIGRGIPWYRLGWNWVSYTVTDGLKFLVRVAVAGYAFPWTMVLVGLLASRICVCVRPIWMPLIYITIFQLAHYPAQILPKLCPSGRLFGLCDYYQNYILFDAIDNVIPPDAVLCNGIAIPVYILGAFILMMAVLLVLSLFSAAIVVSIGRDLVIAYVFIESMLMKVFDVAVSHVEVKEKIE